MAVDASVYSNYKPISLFGAYQRGVDAREQEMRMSDLVKQREEAEGVKAVIAKHTKEDGSFDQPALLSDLFKVSPTTGLHFQNQFAQQGKDLAEQRHKEFETTQKRFSLVGNALESMAGMSPQERAMAYPKVRAQLVSSGIIRPQDAPEEYDDTFFRGTLNQYRGGKDYLDRQKTLAETDKMKAEAAKARAEGRNPTKNLSPGEKQADEVFAKDAADYYYGGGKAGVEKNIARLEGAIQNLKNKPGVTGGWSTRVPLLGSDSAQDSINPDLAAIRDDIRAAIQGTLKQVLGGQYTEKEAEGMFNRAFNSRLSPEENVRRATAELEALRSMAAAKDQSMDHFLASGTLKGYRPSGTNLAAKAPDDGKKKQPGSGPIESAHADEKPSQPPKGMIRMRAPNGQIKLIPESQKGAAIANGGEVVK